MKSILLITLLSFSLCTSAQTDPVSDSSLKLKDSFLTKDFTDEDSIASINFFNEVEAKKAEMAQMALLYPDVHSKVSIEFSGIFYPEPDYALYNLRLKKDDDFNLDQDKFSLKLYKLSDYNEKIWLKTYDFDTIDCLNFVIKLPLISAVKSKYVLDYVDISGKVAKFDEINLNYEKSSLLHISKDLYDKSASHSFYKEESFQDFILREDGLDNSVEKLIYTQNQFNIFPPEILIGNSKNLPPWCGTEEPINPCDSLFFKKWMSQYTVELKGIRELSYYQIEKCLLSNSRFSSLFDTYIKKVLPTWKSWKDSCYVKIELKPRGNELDCDCQRLGVLGEEINNGNYFVKQVHPYSPHQMWVNSSANGNEIRTYWDGTDGKGLFQGNFFGPSFWAVLETWGGCTPAFEGPTYGAGYEAWSDPTKPLTGKNSPLHTIFSFNYVCEKNNKNAGIWPENCACPLDIQGKMYLENTMKASTKPSWSCWRTSVARAEVENAGLGLVRSKYFNQPLNAPTVYFHDAAGGSVESIYKSSFSFDFIFSLTKTIGNAPFLLVPIIGPVAANNIRQTWANTTPILSAFSTGVVTKNNVLVDMNWRMDLHANNPIEASLYSFYRMSAKGEDGWESRATLESRAMNTYFIEGNIPSQSQSQYCCNDFIAKWYQCGEGGVWNTTMRDKTVAFINMNNSAPWINIKTEDNYRHYEEKLGCALFKFKHNLKGNGIKIDNSYLKIFKNEVKWNINKDSKVMIEIVDIMGKKIYSNTLSPQKDLTIFNSSNFPNRLLMILVKDGEHEEMYKLLNNEQ